MGDMAARLKSRCPALALQEERQTLSDGVIDGLQQMVAKD